MATPKGDTKAPVPQPDFGIKFLDIEELPEEPARTRNASYSEVKANLLKLQETPNRWAEVAYYNAKNGSDANPTGAKKVVGKFLDGSVKPPASGEDGGEYDLEYRSAKYDGSERKGSVVLARYVVEG